MSLEANKQIVREFFRRLENGEVEAAATLIADDVQWWVQGSGDVNKAGLLGICHACFLSRPATLRPQDYSVDPGIV